MAAEEKQRKQQSKSLRQSSSFTLPRLFRVRKSQASTGQPQSAGVDAKDPKTQRQSLSVSAGMLGLGLGLGT